MASDGVEKMNFGLIPKTLQVSSMMMLVGDPMETDEWVKATHRPVVIVTSNSEKELPDAFLRRCVFHYIDFPDEEQMRAIIDVHFPSLSGELMQSACKIFYGLREVAGLRKRPSTSELLDWIRVLLASGAKLPEEIPAFKSVPFLGALVKMEEDLDTLTRHGNRSADVRTAGHRFFR